MCYKFIHTSERTISFPNALLSYRLKVSKKEGGGGRNVHGVYQMSVSRKSHSMNIWTRFLFVSLEFLEWYEHHDILVTIFAVLNSIPKVRIVNVYKGSNSKPFDSMSLPQS